MTRVESYMLANEFLRSYHILSQSHEMLPLPICKYQTSAKMLWTVLMSLCVGHAGIADVQYQ